mmetsp:Transcript_20114/g.32755  ORF Transcript_20114/g.32755 Transcript_20114/m.32755 type:complete len:94 (-) Transcript_20114:532-813(-)
MLIFRHDAIAEYVETLHEAYGYRVTEKGEDGDDNARLVPDCGFEGTWTLIWEYDVSIYRSERRIGVGGEGSVFSLSVALAYGGGASAPGYVEI